MHAAAGVMQYVMQAAGSYNYACLRCLLKPACAGAESVMDEQQDMHDELEPATQSADGKGIWGPRGYHFAESGTSHVWGDVADWVAQLAAEKRYIAKFESKNISAERAEEINGFQALWYSCISKSINL